MNEREPSVVIEYIDPMEKFKGWLVIDKTENELCAGGMRVQKGLTLAHLKKMALNMSKKMCICGLPIDGAKSGIDYDPDSLGKEAAICRFIGAIKPFLATCYSMGPDLNTRMEELDKIAASQGLFSIKEAISKVQGINRSEFLNRYKVLDQPAINDWTVGDLRAGYGVAAAAIKTLSLMDIPYSKATVAVQGFGGLAKAAILGVMVKGIEIKAVADAHRTILRGNKGAMPLIHWMKESGTILPDTDSHQVEHRDHILETDCDLLILGAIENVITEKNAHKIKAKAVVPGANLAVSLEAEKILFDRKIIVLPCFAVGCGGSISMNGLFGPKDTPSPLDVLSYIEDTMGEIIRNIVTKSKKEELPPRMAATKWIEERIIPARKAPYAL